MEYILYNFPILNTIFNISPFQKAYLQKAFENGQKLANMTHSGGMERSSSDQLTNQSIRSIQNEVHKLQVSTSNVFVEFTKLSKLQNSWIIKNRYFYKTIIDYLLG